MPVDVVTIESAVLSDPTEQFQYSIENVITDIEFFETLDKPYLTGTGSFADTAGVADAIKFQGFEKLKVSLKHPNHDLPVTKTFIIDKILDITKQNDKVELITFHFIEEHAFISTFLNVNKSYSGSARDIITKILGESFREVGYTLSDGDTSEMVEDMQLIVPNMRPLEACDWIKDRTTSHSGTPYYLFSTLSNKTKIHFLSLASLFSNIPDPTPYTYIQSNTTISESSKYTITSYKSKTGNDISSLIANGSIGAEYNFIDTLFGLQDFKQLDTTKKYGLTDDLTEDGKKTKFTFDTTYTYEGARLSEIASRKAATIMSSASYQEHRSFREVYSKENASWSRALRSLLVSNPIEIVVSGENFFDPDVNLTIGNTINVRFLNSNIQNVRGDDIDLAVDRVKSGRHLIYAAKHIVRREKYDIILSCVKLENEEVV